MATKDWKKVGVNRWRKNGIILDIHTSKSDHHYLAFIAWVVIVKHERSNQYFEDNVFKTKDQALKFAKDYMRRN